MAGRSLFRGLAFLGTVPKERDIKPIRQTPFSRYRVAVGTTVVQGAELCGATDNIPNSTIRVAVGVDGGTERSFAERHLSELSNKGWWLGTWRYSGA